MAPSCSSQCQESTRFLPFPYLPQSNPSVSPVSTLQNKLGFILRSMYTATPVITNSIHINSQSSCLLGALCMSNRWCHSSISSWNKIQILQPLIIYTAWMTQSLPASLASWDTTWACDALPPTAFFHFIYCIHLLQNLFGSFLWFLPLCWISHFVHVLFSWFCWIACVVL